jgi:hypothetical protein
MSKIQVVEIKYSCKSCGTNFDQFENMEMHNCDKELNEAALCCKEEVDFETAKSAPSTLQGPKRKFGVKR